MRLGAAKTARESAKSPLLLCMKSPSEQPFGSGGMGVHNVTVFNIAASALHKGSAASLTQ
jgi:hypothetical protein